MTKAKQILGGTNYPAFFFSKGPVENLINRQLLSFLLSIIIVALLLVSTTAFAAKVPGETRKSELLHMLKHDCGSCHGLTLKGGLGPALTPQALANKPTPYLVQTILDGRPGTPMPPWEAILSRQEVSWLVNVLQEGLDRVR